MNLEPLIERFKQFNAQIEAAHAQMKSDSQALIFEASRDLFRTAPEIDRVYWTQYTPYFNDGSPCSFGVNDIYFVLDGEEDEGESSYLYTQDDYDRALENLEQVRQYVVDPTTWFEAYKRKNKISDNAKLEWHRPWPYTVERAQEELAKIELQRALYTLEDAERINKSFEAFCNAISLIPDHIMETVYGDHVKVTITRTGTETDHYDHD